MREGCGDSQVHQGSPCDLPGLPDWTATYVAIAWPNNSTGNADLEGKCRAHTCRQEPEHPTCHAKSVNSNLETEALSSSGKLNIVT